ncbi:importin-like protein [Trifolium pratense]|uniref:Importin-like protein n=1 Tax=Trifolium pratense TaxID=57577 RepID=A0A2K3NJ27_TRIPR|nr:importin-like protein [Trifolium pratense]
MLKEKYAYHSRWQIRHAAMFAVGYIATNNFNAGMGMVNYFEKVAILVLNCLDETNNRVLWAAMHSIILLAECTQVLMHTQYDKKFLEKLAPITKRYTCGRVQSYAVITVRLLEKTCGLDMDTDAPEFTALQDSNVANHQNDLTIKLDTLENELNAENNCLALSQRIILSAAEVNDILHGATEK